MIDDISAVVLEMKPYETDISLISDVTPSRTMTIT
jgi:hypothetical protein